MADCLLLQKWAASPHLKQELKARFEKDNSKAEESLTNGNIFYPSEVIKVLNSIFREKEAHMLREACYLPHRKNNWGEKKSGQEAADPAKKRNNNNDYNDKNQRKRTQMQGARLGVLEV